MRELLWAIAALGGTLIWFLWKTWDQGPIMEDLLSQATLLAFVKVYGGMVLARLAWWALRAVARSVS
jgi:hypothetical protein